MGLKTYKPFTNGRRHMVSSDFSELTTSSPEKSLMKPIKRTGGRNSSGRLTIRHRGGGAKRSYRVIDFLRIDKLGVPAVIKSIEYDPNRNCRIALVFYADGEKRYVLAAEEMKVGMSIVCDQVAEIEVGNRMYLKNIPEGFAIYNLELHARRGGVVVRTAGNSAKIMSKEGVRVQVKMPSGEIRLFQPECFATIGVVGNAEQGNIKLGKAGRMRWLGRRPQVRGKVMNPCDHPHGGGEARNSIGMDYPKTPWGAHALGVKTRRNKVSNSFILSSRHEVKKR